MYQNKIYERIDMKDYIYKVEYLEGSLIAVGTADAGIIIFDISNPTGGAKVPSTYELSNVGELFGGPRVDNISSGISETSSGGTPSGPTDNKLLIGSDIPLPTLLEKYESNF